MDCFVISPYAVTTVTATIIAMNIVILSLEGYFLVGSERYTADCISHLIAFVKVEGMPNCVSSTSRNFRGGVTVDTVHLVVHSMNVKASSAGIALDGDIGQVMP